MHVLIKENVYGERETVRMVVRCDQLQEQMVHIVYQIQNRRNREICGPLDFGNGATTTKKIHREW